jgi:hypothetical protein
MVYAIVRYRIEQGQGMFGQTFKPIWSTLLGGFRMRRSKFAQISALLLMGMLGLGLAPAHAQLLEQGDRPGIARAIAGGCQQRPLANDPIALADTVACTAMDFVIKSNLPSSPVRELSYAETAEFNIALHRSLKARHKTVTVSVVGDTLPLTELDIDMPYPDSPAMAFWLARIVDTGGVNVPCSQPAPGAIFGLLDMAIRYITAELDKWVTYGPAKRYNTRIDYVAGTKGAFVARKITFVRRDQGKPTCAASPKP